ncbi:hypothetical protein Leryth_013953 [Lithospermum erythrorhizon]|nr:hypothetical protein Leryth_013953 [Lithospermum erythrorhizon]
MLRAKSRSGSVDLGHKNHSSIFSRSKLCRGDAIGSQIDSKALVSADNKPTKAPYLPEEKRISRDMIMQGQMEQLVDELNRTKEDLDVAEGEKERLVGEIKKMKQAGKVEAMRVSEANELKAEVRSLKELLSNSKDELKQKDRKIKSLEVELENVKKLETELAGRDTLIERLREELNNVRESESRVADLSADNKRRIMELEEEVERGKISERKMLESFQHQTKLLEETKIELEEAKLELATLQKGGNRDVNESSKKNVVQSTEAVENLKSELQLARDQLGQALDSEKTAQMKIGSLQDELVLIKNELGSVKNELKQATGAEETSKKAMDELAIALKEVATESNQVKGKLQGTVLELENVKKESEQFKDMVGSTEEKYQELLDEAKKETELYRNIADRLRLEAEETLLAWNGKEMGFVKCIKTTEDEKAVVQHEKAKLVEALKAAETLTRSAREENFKLRDILKQAINEANASKAAASIARDENSLLKDSLSEKDEELLNIHKENERLRINEVAAKENLKEFKKLLSSASMECKADNKEMNANLKSSSSDDEHNKEVDNENEVEENGEKRTFSFDLDELNVLDDQDSAEEGIKPEDPEKEEALKGSIFDSAEEPTRQEDPEKAEVLKSSNFDSFYSPKSEPHSPTDIGTPNSEDHGSVDSHHLCDSISDSNNCRRKKALFRRVSDIIMKKKTIQ